MSEPVIHFREMRPPTELARWVEALWFIQTVSPLRGEVQHWVLPDASINLVLWAPRGWKQAKEVVPPIVSGPSTKEYRRRAAPGEAYVGVRFVPGAGATFLGCPARQLTSMILSLEQLQPVWAEQFWKRLRLVGSEGEALVVVQSELVKRCSAVAEPDLLMIKAAAWQRRQPGPLSLQRWCSRFGLSARQFRRRFQEAVGLSPRSFARVVRMQSLVRQHLLQPEVHWGPVSYQAGFADQAHLANEFRSLSGGRPRHFHEHLQGIDHETLSEKTLNDGRKFQDTVSRAV